MSSIQITLIALVLFVFSFTNLVFVTIFTLLCIFLISVSAGFFQLMQVFACVVQWPNDAALQSNLQDDSNQAMLAQ